MTGNWLVAVFVLAVLVYGGMGVRAALLLRRADVPAPRAWLAGVLAWPLVRRIVSEPGRPGTDES